MAIGTISKLKEERNRLLKLANRQEKISVKRRKLANEEMKLREEIANLKRKTRNKVISALGRMDNPKNREKIKKGFQAFQRYANRL